MVIYAKKLFPNHDRRKIVRAIWKTRTLLRKSYKFPEYLIGFKYEINPHIQLRDCSPCLDFNDFINRYAHLQPPFFLLKDGEVVSIS